MKTLVIGDIHGCYTELMELLAMSGLSEHDSIVALGCQMSIEPFTIETLTDGINLITLLNNNEYK
jgi:serine/threonine protein phosphatase 1